MPTLYVTPSDRSTIATHMGPAAAAANVGGGSPGSVTSLDYFNSAQEILVHYADGSCNAPTDAYNWFNAQIPPAYRTSVSVQDAGEGGGGGMNEN